MTSVGHIQPHPARENLFSSKDVLALLQDRHWLSRPPTAEHLVLCERAANLLGPHAADPAGLVELLGLIFHYHAGQILATVEAHAVLARFAAREVIRQVALFLLDPTPLDSDRLKELVTRLKETHQLRGRDLFHPLRLALAGRPGEGELDRVILLVDEAAALAFDVTVKSTRTRILEFCATLDC